MHYILRIVSIAAYFSIFLQGEHISGNMVLLMFVALFNANLADLAYILGAFSGLIVLGFLMIFPKTKRTLVIDSAVFVLLLLPILVELKPNPDELIKYRPFVIP